MVDNSGSGFRAVYHRTVLLLISILVLVGAALILLPSILHLGPDSTMREIFRDFGIAVLVAGLVGTGYEYWLRNAFRAEVKQTLSQIINERHAELDKLRVAGVKTIYRVLPHAQLVDKFEGAERSIRILQTWSGDFNAIGYVLARAAKKGCEVNILLLNPDSPQAEQRGRDLGYEDATAVRALIRNDLSTLRKSARQCTEEARGRIKVKLYSSTPIMPIYGYDDTNVVGTYWRGRHSQEGPQYELVRPESADGHPDGELYLAEAVDEHFNAIWNDETTTEWDPNQEWEDSPPSTNGSRELVKVIEEMRGEMKLIRAEVSKQKRGLE